MQMHANRTLRPRLLSDGTRRGLDGYRSFAHASKPAWWSDEIPFAHDAFGVYENTPGSRRDAFVFTEHHLVVLHDDEPTFLPFDEIARLVLPMKEPLPRALEVVLRSTDIVALPVIVPGVVFTLYQFLLSAFREVRRRRGDVE